MKSYKELQTEIQNLQAEAEKARQLEIGNAIVEIKEKMQEYGITVADLAEAEKKKTRRHVGTVEPKYRDAATGETWTGRGKPPRWIAGKDREQFLIKNH